MGATPIIGVFNVVAATINEGVLLITYADDLQRERHLSPLDAVVEAAKIRLRPRMMIALAIIFGFIPLALNLEEGGEMLQPMAAGAIGGLALGLTLALVFVMVYLNNRFMAKLTSVVTCFSWAADLPMHFHCAEAELQGEKAKNYLSQEQFHE